MDAIFHSDLDHVRPIKPTTLEDTYRKRAREKRAYDRRVIEVDRTTFTPLVMSVTGSMAKTSTIFYKRLAAMLAVINLIRCRLSFCLLRAAIVCICSSRSTATKLRSEPYDVQCAAAGLWTYMWCLTSIINVQITCMSITNYIPQLIICRPTVHDCYVINYQCSLKNRSH